MNWKAEFSKAGELALASGTLMVLGWGVFTIGKGFWNVAIAPEIDPSEVAGDFIGWAILAVFLTVLFLGWYRRDKACAGAVAFMLNVVASIAIGSILSECWRMVDFQISFEQIAGEMFIASLIWILGLLLLWCRCSKSLLSPAIYILVFALFSAPLSVMLEGMSQTWM